MSDLGNTEKQILEELLEMDTGYVLDFSNNTFQDFVKTSVDIDIYDDKYDLHSGSKANRLRALWNKESDEIVGKLILDLLEQMELEITFGDKDELSDAESKMVNKVKERAEKMAGINADTYKEGDIRNNIEEVEITESIIDDLNLPPEVNQVIAQRIKEIRQCVQKDIRLATLFLCGSTLEGILIIIAKRNNTLFTQAKAAPKSSQSGKVIPLEKWKLNSLIDVAYEVGVLEEDVKRHSHAMRHFRNYIHPQEQVSENFSPSEDTSEIMWRVLKAAINQIAKNTNN
ncbi:MAG: hypothetical protein WD335_03530 [Candidatus Paceibacterota bacterium]